MHDIVLYKNATHLAHNGIPHIIAHNTLITHTVIRNMQTNLLPTYSMYNISGFIYTVVNKNVSVYSG